MGVSTKTLQRNEKFLDAYEDIERNVGKEKADEIAKNLPKQDIIQIGKVLPFKQEEIINKFDAVDKMSRASIADELGVSDKTLQRAEKFLDERNKLIFTEN